MFYQQHVHAPAADPNETTGADQPAWVSTTNTITVHLPPAGFRGQAPAAALIKISTLFSLPQP